MPKANVIVAYVRSHPGVKPRPYLIPAWKKATELLKKRLLPQAVKRARKTGDLNAALDWAVRAAVFSAQQSAIRRVPVRTGRLRGSINVQRRKPLHYTVGTNVAYARVVEYGTRKKNYPIVPNRGKVLAFYTNKPKPKKKATRKRAKRKRTRKKGR